MTEHDFSHVYEFLCYEPLGVTRSNTSAHWFADELRKAIAPFDCVLLNHQIRRHLQPLIHAANNLGKKRMYIMDQEGADCYAVMLCTAISFILSCSAMNEKIFPKQVKKVQTKFKKENRYNLTDRVIANFDVVSYKF